MSTAAYPSVQDQNKEKFGQMTQILLCLSKQLVGAEGFELSTYGTQNRRATRLRYAPTDAVLTKIAAEGKPLLAGPSSLF